jgi:DNA-binding response OmpR family regulator
VILPGIKGREVCKRLKNDELTKNIPVIFITGMDTTKNLIDCYEYGADDFLNKSVSPRTLISQIELTLEDYISPVSS